MAPRRTSNGAVTRRRKLYEGKAKIIYATDDPRLVIQYFKDDATAFNAEKRGTIAKKGILNNLISSRIFEAMENKGIATHYVQRLSDREMLVKRLEIVPLEVVVRNVVAGSLAKRLGLPEGTPVPRPPIIEFYYKRDDLGDPMITEEHILRFKLATAKQLAGAREAALVVNKFLKPYFARRRIILVDYKLEFGMAGRRLLLGDEITPDGCRLWDADTREKMDKDRFRRDLGKIEEAYQEVARRVLGRAAVLG